MQEKVKMLETENLQLRQNLTSFRSKVWDSSNAINKKTLLRLKAVKELDNTKNEL